MLLVLPICCQQLSTLWWFKFLTHQQGVSCVKMNEAECDSHFQLSTVPQSDHLVSNGKNIYSGTVFFPPTRATQKTSKVQVILNIFHFAYFQLLCVYLRFHDCRLDQQITLPPSLSSVEFQWGVNLTFWNSNGAVVIMISSVLLPEQIAFSQQNSIMDLVQFFVTFFRWVDQTSIFFIFSFFSWNFFFFKATFASITSELDKT